MQGDMGRPETGTHAGVTLLFGPRSQVAGGRRSCRPASFRDLGDAAPSLRLGRVVRGRRCGRLLGAEGAQEVEVFQPPLGVDRHLLPEPVELAKEQRSSPQGPDPSGCELLGAGSAAKEKTWKKETRPSCRPQLGGSLQKAGRAEAESYPWLPQGILKLIWALSERFKAIKSCDQAQRLSCGTEGCFRSKCKPGEPSQAPCCCLQAPEPCEQRTMCHGPRPPCLRPQFISPSGQMLSSHDMKREAFGELVGLHGFVLVSSDATDSQSRTLRSLLEPLWMT